MRYNPADAGETKGEKWGKKGDVRRETGKGAGEILLFQCSTSTGRFA